MLNITTAPSEDSNNLCNTIMLPNKTRRVSASVMAAIVTTAVSPKDCDIALIKVFCASVLFNSLEAEAPLTNMSKEKDTIVLDKMDGTKEGTRLGTAGFDVIVGYTVGVVGIDVIVGNAIGAVGNAVGVVGNAVGVVGNAVGAVGNAVGAVVGSRVGCALGNDEEGAPVGQKLGEIASYTDSR